MHNIISKSLAHQTTSCVESNSLNLHNSMHFCRFKYAVYSNLLRRSMLRMPATIWSYNMDSSTGPYSQSDILSLNSVMNVAVSSDPWVCVLNRYQIMIIFSLPVQYSLKAFTNGSIRSSSDSSIYMLANTRWASGRATWRKTEHCTSSGLALTSAVFEYILYALYQVFQFLATFVSNIGGPVGLRPVIDISVDIWHHVIT